eukprot:TRINITY_DN10160_c0_g1_i2.p1 TRINITY_DN10160_c0_g1~~TRINITY_DN10160_c0_g1_i2.p1  ORF type:complete len:413 (+),score=120.81 TRINITY_DN10160_c0_g1_i2:69-1241(+)
MAGGQPAPGAPATEADQAGAAPVAAAGADSGGAGAGAAPAAATQHADPAGPPAGAAEEGVPPPRPGVAECVRALLRCLDGAGLGEPPDPGKGVRDYLEGALPEAPAPGGSPLCVRSYAHAGFRALRRRVCGEGAEAELPAAFARAADSEGEKKGSLHGSVFVGSSCGRWLLKVGVSDAELRLLVQLLEEYTAHIAAAPSLLVPYLGLFSCHWAGGSRRNFVLMPSLVCPLAKCVYDLKGSTEGRDAKRGDKKRAVPLLKDNDFRKLRQKERPAVAPEGAAALAAAAARDAEWLRARNILDYSLVCVVCAPGPEPAQLATDCGRFVLPLKGGGGFVRCGVIDYLTIFTGAKEAVTSLKSFFGAKTGDGSCVPPAEYAPRFAAWVAQCFPAG